jgi:DNA-binding SARP family transcriptional activator
MAAAVLSAEFVLHVRCLGAFALRAGGEWTGGPAFRHGRELLQYLVSYRRSAASRDALVGAFWPTLDAQTGAHRLHIAVAGARRTLRALCPNNEGIRCSGGAYAWDPAVRIDTDADQVLAASRGASTEAMRHAATLYAGEYLAGEQAEWMYPLRLRFANAYATILERLAEEAIARQDYVEGLDYGLRLVETDRAHEGATRLVMRCFAASGRRGAALAAYTALEAYLQHHLALKPSARTYQLRERIIEG